MSVSLRHATEERLLYVATELVDGDNLWRLLLVGFFAELAVFAAETLHASGRIHQLLFAGEIRMAVGADFDGDLLAGRPSLVLGAAGTGDRHLIVLRMDACFHVHFLYDCRSNILINRKNNGRFRG